MKRLLAIGSVALALAVIEPPAFARGGGGGGHGMHGGMGGGFSGHRGPGPGHGSFRGHGGSHLFFGFGFPFVVDPFFYYPYAYPYYAPYPAYGYPPPPPPEEPGSEAGDQPYGEPEAEASPPAEEQPSPEEAQRATYGLVQLRGVPDGASVDLDGRFWMKAQGLASRWLALPRGSHTLTVHVEGREPAEKDVDVEPGKTQVLRFGPFTRPS